MTLVKVPSSKNYGSTSTSTNNANATAIGRCILLVLILGLTNLMSNFEHESLMILSPPSTSSSLRGGGGGNAATKSASLQQQEEQQQLPVVYECPSIPHHQDDITIEAIIKGDASTVSAKTNNSVPVVTKSFNTEVYKDYVSFMVDQHKQRQKLKHHENEQENPGNEDDSDIDEDPGWNVTDFIATFRHSEFDKWGLPYEKVKQESYAWKSKHYAPFLQSGGTIYESATGIGLNLVMTLEILYDDFNISDLVVYGNEYLDVSNQKANILMDHGILPGNAKKGKLCTGDSTQISSSLGVPSDSFDLVFSGYVSPMMDPLEFGLPTNQENYAQYKKLCESDPNSEHEQELLRKSQQIQNDWYGQWVYEMARIAKPGGAVIVEQVSVPYCNAYIDWGGVAQEFWYESAKSNVYGWDVDPESIVIELDTIFYKRYHVRMIKNKKLS